MTLNKKIAQFRILALLILLICALWGSSWASEKKGVGLWDLGGKERIEALNVAWYYTWQPEPIRGVPRSKFVPMVAGLNPLHLQREISRMRRMGRVPVLLAINEPDVADTKLAIPEVLRRWPEIAGLADSVSSPAPGTALGPWSNRFFRLAKERHLKMDFMAVHLYTPPDAKFFVDQIDKIYKKFRLPIWITEFAVADWDARGKPGTNRYQEAEVLAFMKALLPKLEKRKFIKRYAWFGAGPIASMREQVRTSRLFEPDGRLNPLGKFYAEFKWPITAENREKQMLQ